jgi:hypothetical protein
MENLSELTFIIPVNIEHPDRYKNAKTVLEYLNFHFNTKVIIYQTLKPDHIHLDFLDSLKNLEITHVKENIDQSSPFHKTLYLKRMIEMVKTPVFCQYDIDIILPVDSYIKCKNLVLSGEYDLALPFPFKKRNQVKIYQSFNREPFMKDFNIDSILESKDSYFLEMCEYGHCSFFNTSDYINSGGENINFVSWGPEDIERVVRYEKLGKKIIRLEGLVFHFEHYRTESSSTLNPFFRHNESLFNEIRSMDKHQIKKYYKIK